MRYLVSVAIPHQRIVPAVRLRAHDMPVPDAGLQAPGDGVIELGVGGAATDGGGGSPRGFGDGKGRVEADAEGYDFGDVVRAAKHQDKKHTMKRPKECKRRSEKGGMIYPERSKPAPPVMVVETLYVLEKEAEPGRTCECQHLHEAGAVPWGIMEERITSTRESIHSGARHQIGAQRDFLDVADRDHGVHALAAGADAFWARCRCAGNEWQQRREEECGRDVHDGLEN